MGMAESILKIENQPKEKKFEKKKKKGLHFINITVFSYERFEYFNMKTFCSKIYNTTETIQFVF